MTALFAAVLGIGVAGLLVFVAVGDRVAANEQMARRSIAGAMAFGLGGMSASFAGLAPVVSLGLAIAAAVAFVLYSDRADADHQ